MENHPKVPTNTELYLELVKLKNRMEKLEFTLECLRAEHEGLRRKVDMGR